MSGHTSKTKKAMFGLSLGALGIVYGDIGTSPLYAMNEIFFGHAHTQTTTSNVVGVVSVVVWALAIIVALKYMLLVLRADSQGEGGVFALLGLLHPSRKKWGVGTATLFLIVAAGFLYGDGLITPAISVLSATEGLKLITTSAQQFIVPLTIVILAGLFLIQSKGTHKVGTFFGPIMVVWFAMIAFLGIKQIVLEPSILQALNPIHAIQFIGKMPIGTLFIVLGSVMLVVTGGEAVFADMGHFGRFPIRLSWFAVVMPALFLSYMGQGAYLLSGQLVKDDNLFFSLVPESMLIPAVIIATLATIIASQALISGAFSLTSQAIALELLPKTKIFHTHEHHEGQIYLPIINWMLFAGCVMVVLGFRSSSALAAAYGLAVSVVMVVTSMSMMLVSRLLWNWSMTKALLVWTPLFLIDIMFLSANSIKFLEGGFVPVVIGIILANIMLSWKWGRGHVVSAYSRAGEMTMGEVVTEIDKEKSHFPKSMLVLTASKVDSPDDKIPPQLQLFYNKYGKLPEHLIVLRVVNSHDSHIKEAKRYSYNLFTNKKDTNQVISVTVKYGFMETIDLEEALRHIARSYEINVQDDLKNWLILVSKAKLKKGSKPTARGITRLRHRIFAVLAQNASPSYEYYGLGDDSRLVIENLPISFDNI